MKSHGAGSSKQASSKRASARPHTPGTGEALDQEKPDLNGHRSGQANGWQRGFLNQAASSHGKAGTTSLSAHEQEFEPDGSRAESSGASSSEQWEPHDSQNGHFAVQVCLVCQHCTLSGTGMVVKLELAQCLTLLPKLLSCGLVQGENGSDAMPSLERRGDPASSNLYEAAKVLSNREAAAGCASMAQDALAEADFDKAVRLSTDTCFTHEVSLTTCMSPDNLIGMQERLFQKAERLAPGQYAEKVQAVERRRKAHEAQMAAKVVPSTSACWQCPGQACCR